MKIFLNIFFLFVFSAHIVWSFSFSQVNPKIESFLNHLNTTLDTPLAIKEERLGYESRALNYGGIPVSVARVEDIQISSFDPSRSIKLRIYTPQLGKKLPVMLYFHGGGWQKGSLNTHDSICRRLANKVGCIVVAVDWRLAPENKFPAALYDCQDVYKWIFDEGKTIYNFDINYVILAGDSPGGNLAAALSFKLKTENEKLPLLQLLIYPTLDLKMTSETYQKYETGYLLTAKKMKYYIDNYINSAKDLENPLASPLAANNFEGLPTTYIITAGFDPLRGDGERYAKKLEEANVKTKYQCYPDMIHGFLHFTAFIPEIETIFDEIASSVKELLYHN